MDESITGESEAEDFLSAENGEKTGKGIEEDDVCRQRDKKQPEQPEPRTGENKKEIENKDDQEKNPGEFGGNFYLVVSFEDSEAVCLFFFFKKAAEGDFGERTQREMKEG